MRFFPPRPELRDVVSRLYVHQTAGGGGLARTPWLIVPDGDIKIIFPVRGDITCAIGRHTRTHRAGRLIISAMRAVPGTLAFSDGLDAIGVIIRPEAAYRLLRVPHHEMANRTLDGEELFGRAAREWEDQLAEITRLDDRIDALQRRLIEWLHRRDHRERSYEQATRVICATSGRIRVEHLAQELGFSRRTLERRFREYAGVGAKQLADILRFHAVYRRLRHAPTARYVDLADAGYADQSHFIKSFKHYTGITPRAYRTAADYGRLYIPH